MIPCPKCKAELYPIHTSHWVTCSACFHKWELNDDNTAIKSVTIEIKKVVKTLSASALLRGK